MNRIKTVLTAIAVTSALALSTAAAAITKYKMLELEGLTPELRKQVEARMTGRPTVRGILKTTLLNSISDKVAYNQVVVIDFDKAVIVVTNPKGAVRAYSFDTATLVVDPNRTPKPGAPGTTATKK